ncbi:MAG: glycosyltransferase family A protein [Patescibacteria group bacterium]
MSPKVSIIIPAYQAEKTIKKCLDSIFPQTFNNFEVIVVNDGSADETLKILKSYEIPRYARNDIIKIINQKNQGSNPARNRGVKEAKGNYLLFCDADIEMKPQMLEKMVEILEKNLDKSFAYSSFYFGFKKFKLWPYSVSRLKKMPYIHTTSLIRQKYFPGFDENIKRLQDWDLFLTMSEQKHYGIFIPEFLFKIHPRKKGLSSWLPKSFYKIPWQKFGIKIKSLEEYKKAEKIIKEKHKLP